MGEMGCPLDVITALMARSTSLCMEASAAMGVSVGVRRMSAAKGVDEGAGVPVVATLRVDNAVVAPGGALFASGVLSAGVGLAVGVTMRVAAGGSGSGVVISGGKNILTTARPVARIAMITNEDKSLFDASAASRRMA